MNEQKIAPVLSDGEQIEEFITWFRSAPHRDKYDASSPAFLAAWESWQAVLARVGAVREQALEEAAIACETIYPTMRSGWAKMDQAVNAIRALKVTPAAAPELISAQEAWEAAGGNPGIKATKAELLHTLNVLDQVCDEADGKTPAAAVSEAERIRQLCFSELQGLDYKAHAAMFSPQPSSNPGPLAAVEPSVDLSVDAENRARGLAIDRACIELPDGWRIQIDLERDAGTVCWLNPYHGLWHHVDGGGELFSDQIQAAIDAAIAASKEGASHADR